MIATATTVVSRTLAGVGLATSLGAIAVVALIIMLIAREISTLEMQDSEGSEALRAFATYLLVPISSFLVVLGVIIVVNALTVL